MESEKKFRYRVSQSQNNPQIFFVKVRKDTEWVYAGFLSLETGKYIKGARGQYEVNTDPIKGILYALRKGNNPLSRPTVMYHHDKCARCGRKLMDRQSIERGFGPECWVKRFGF